MGDCVGHEPCPCGVSSDALARYADGSAFCFRCNKPFDGDGKRVERSTDVLDQDDTGFEPVRGSYMELSDRKLREETCRFWKYEMTRDGLNGKPAHVMNIFVGQKLVAQKYRTKETKGLWAGDKAVRKHPPFYGQWLFGRGKYLVITEGELDAMSVSQAMDLKWPVVSLPNGVGSVKQAIKDNYDWLQNFEEIVLMFDMDEPGQKAFDEAVELLPAGKVKIASLPEKDANEVLKKHGPGRLVKAFWDASPYRPDGIISGEDITLEELMEQTAKGYALRIPKLNERLLGMRKGEIHLWTAGSGIGKSTALRQLAYELHQDHKLTIGNVFLEEKYRKTAQGYIALDNSVPLGKLRHNAGIIKPDQWKQSYENIIRNRMYFYNHFGSLESKVLLGKLRYMAQVLKVDFIILDHISIVTSGMESSSEGERKDIDILMTRLRSLVEETGVGVLAVVHLKRVQGKNFNEGAQVSLTDLRGSASLEQLSDNVIGLERNQQDDDDTKMNVRVLKCRETGETGLADTLEYRRDTGKLVLSEAQKAFKPEATDQPPPF